MGSLFWSTSGMCRALLAANFLNPALITFFFLANTAIAKDLQPQVTFKKGKIEIQSAKSKVKKTLVVEFAETPAQQQKGLMYRISMPKDEGMLFVFGEPRELAFWMKNTYIDLDIAYIDSKLKIVDIQQMKATSSLQTDIPSYPTKKPAQYALEMNKNWFQNNKFKVGDQIKILKN